MRNCLMTLSIQAHVSGSRFAFSTGGLSNGIDQMSLASGSTPFLTLDRRSRPRLSPPSPIRCGRDFAAWIGLVPKQNSSGARERLGNITKAGDRYLRSLFCAGALAVIRFVKQHDAKHRPWLTSLMDRRPIKVAAIALADKLARMAWAMMAKGESYKEPVALAR